MFFFKEVIQRFKFWGESDRLGPDIPVTHWRLYFKSTSKKLCKKKFKEFGFEAEFRPGSYATACSKISIGNHSVIRPGSFLFADPAPGGAGITIESQVLIGNGVHIYTNDHQFRDPLTPIINQGYPGPIEADSVVIRKGCWIGSGVIILKGVEIGENAVIGAGTVVTRSVPPRVVFAGNPGKVINHLN